jgi:hypothetical protein
VAGEFSIPMEKGRTQRYSVILNDYIKKMAINAV